MAETTSESALSEEELEYFRKKLLAMRDEIYAESAATVEEMQNESTLYRIQTTEPAWKPSTSTP